jgi:hypothetical protein
LSPNKIDSIAFKSVVSFKMLMEKIQQLGAAFLIPEDMFNQTRIV